MLESPRFAAAVSVVLLVLTTACSSPQQAQNPPSAPTSPKSPPATPSPVTSQALSSATAAPAAKPQPDSFQNAVNSAMSAAKLAQSAKSKNDWNLVVSRWQNSINLLKAVPKSSPNHAKAQKKIAEYQRNLAYAQRQGNSSSNPTAVATPSASPTAQVDTFQDAQDSAISAATIAQSAESQDDWKLVVSRWQNAINLLKAVPQSSPNYATAQRKIPEYQRSLSYAQQQTQPRPKPTNSP